MLTKNSAKVGLNPAWLADECEQPACPVVFILAGGWQSVRRKNTENAVV